ncbi:MAG: hypothetical protein A2W93_11765 [Bacteroidetes bacterium GWF2_43_63]|nr:MAG: hypothetical protein A2W94_14635 [Bacteroidetes bacterium GWE2_42_42]OFY54943.1 MAG: hypothetical protein A2W93_11765 [Bacteroidetes bacterium GWF2_43_63]HCB63146.1 hypothetical protein [Bacteroidales bacterium]HCY22249.1 hypothetical protein [Bacteroidales bacterium]
MANEIIKNGIIGALESLVEMTANVTETEGPIHQLDIDLLQDQIRKFYREIQMLDEANRKILNAGIPVKQNSQPVEPETPVIEKVEVVAEKPSEPAVEIPVPVIETVVEVSEEKPIEIISQTQPAEEKREAEVVEMQHETVVEFNQNPIKENNGGDLFSQPVTIAEKLKKEDNSINQQLMNNNAVRNEKLIGSPIQNLKAAIGINDKFIFVNELFKGEMKDYDLVLNTINEVESEQAAMSILHENLQKRGTLEKTDIRMKLERFIQRRFA